MTTKTLEEIDKKLEKARARWVAAAPKDKTKHMPEINKLLDERLKIKTKKEPIRILVY